ncbi:hypothetical protein B0H14DRAFT_2449660 [Mycena olivaceomarginata]|nr:hypothetical protein B0H14DRAFT_2449660 [Mycena olivaceomarginata]
MAEIFLQLAAIEARSEHWWDYYNDRKLFKQEYTSRPFPNRAPLIFGAICREWRAISLSTPSLWNCISLECTNENMQNNVSLCNMWLKRSGALPLSIQFHRSDSEDGAPRQIVDDYRDLLRTIFPYAQRWRVLDLKKFPSYDTFHTLLPNFVPMLETLSVSHDWREQPTLTSTPWAGLLISPKLRFLYFDSIDSADIMVGGERPTFPWSQLTHIDVGDCSAYDCLRILGEASTAVACRFIVQRLSFLQHPPISHPGLQTLKFEVHDTALPVWDLLTCSTLSTLSVEGRTMAAGPYLRGLPSFVTRSGATIQHFKIRPSGLDDTEFMSCLSAMPQLRSLDIAEVFGGQTQFTEQVWESLTWAAAEDSPAPLVPNLESLSLHGDFNFSHKFVVRMLNSRVQTAARPANFSPKLKAVTFVMENNEVGLPQIVCI